MSKRTQLSDETSVRSSLMLLDYVILELFDLKVWIFLIFAMHFMASDKW